MALLVQSSNYGTIITKDSTVTGLLYIWVYFWHSDIKEGHHHIWPGN